MGQLPRNISARSVLYPFFYISNISSIFEKMSFLSLVVLTMTVIMISARPSEIQNSYDELDIERQNEISKEIKNEIQRLKHSYKENDESDLGRESGRQNGFDFQRFRIKKSNSILQNAY